MKKIVLIFFIFNLLIISKIAAQTPIRVRDNNMMLLCDETSGKVLLPKIYKSISPFSEGIARVEVSNGIKYIDEKGEKINEHFYLGGGTCKNGLIAVHIAEGKYEYTNKKGKKAFEDTFYYASDFSEGYAIVTKLTGETAIINTKGKFCFEKQLKKIREKLPKFRMYSYGNFFSGGLAIISNTYGEQQFLLNKNGDVLEMPPIKDKNKENEAYVGRWLVDERESNPYYHYGKYAIFNHKNKFVGHFRFIESVGKGRFFVRNEKEESYFMDINGNKISENLADNIEMNYNEAYILLFTRSRDTNHSKTNFKVFDKKLKEIKIKKLQKNIDDVHIITLENDMNIITGRWSYSFITSNTPIEGVVNYLDSTKHIVDGERSIIIKNKGKFGAINWEGKLTIPCEYDSIGSFGNMRSIGGIGDSGGYGNLGITYERTYETTSYDCWTIGYKNGKPIKITRTNKILDSEDASGIFQQRNGKWGSDGHLPFEYDECPILPENTDKLFFITNQNGAFGLIELNEKEKFVEILANAYSYIESKSNLFVVTGGAKVGAMWNGDDKTLKDVLKGNKMCFPIEYDDISVDYDGKYAITNKNGNLDKISLTDFKSVYPAGYESYQETYFGVSEHLIVAKNKKKGVLRLSDKKLIIPCEYDSLEYEGYDLMRVRKNEKVGLLDSTGKLVDYESFQETSFGMNSDDYGTKTHLIVLKNKKKGIIRLSDSKLIVPCEYDDFRERRTDRNYTLVHKNGKVGLLDSTGKLVIPCEYDNVNDTFMDEGAFLIFTKNNKQGVVSIQNKIVIPLIYDEVGVFHIDGRPIAVQKNGKWGFLDKNMKLFIPTEYDSYSAERYFRFVTFEGNNVLLPKGYYFAFLSKKGKNGVIDSKGKILIPFEYDEINEVEEKNYTNNLEKPLFIARKGTIETPFYWNGKTVSKTPKK